MKRLGMITIVASALLLLGAREASVPQERVPPPGEGTICAWAILSFVSETAGRCRPNADPEAKAALRRAVTRLDDYMRANAQLTEEQIAAFKADQAHTGAPAEEICSFDDTDTAGMVDGFLAMSPTEMDRWSTEITAQPGTPSWGTCL